MQKGGKDTFLHNNGDRMGNKALKLRRKSHARHLRKPSSGKDTDVVVSGNVMGFLVARVF